MYSEKSIILTYNISNYKDNKFYTSFIELM